MDRATFSQTHLVTLNASNWWASVCRQKRLDGSFSKSLESPNSWLEYLLDDLKHWNWKDRKTIFKYCIFEWNKSLNENDDILKWGIHYWMKHFQRFKTMFTTYELLRHWVKQVQIFEKNVCNLRILASRPWWAEGLLAPAQRPWTT
jgi:hypothetical protein